MPAKTMRSTLLRRFVTTTLAVAALGVSADVLAQTAQTAKEADLRPASRSSNEW